MNVAFFTDTYLPTINGVSYAIKNWKNELESRGHEATVFCPDPGGEESNVMFRSVKFPFYDGFRAALIPPVTHDFSQYDVVHINTYFTIGFYGFYIARKHDLPLIAPVHTPIEEYLDYVSSSPLFQAPAGKAYDRWESWIISKADVCIAPSEDMRERIQERVDREVEVLTNGVDTEFFQPVDTTAFRDRYDIAADRIIGYTGRLGEEKRVDELVAVADRFDGQVLIGGDGPSRDELEEQAADMDNVSFLGFLDREELPALYTTLDFLVFPSRVENDPLVALEANACGTPVIGAHAAGLRNSIQDGVNGYTYQPGDITDLHAKLQDGYDNLEQLREGALTTAEERSVEQVVDTLLTYYRQAAATHGGRSLRERVLAPLHRFRNRSRL